MKSDDLPKELETDLLDIANAEKALVMSFIAPEKLVRISPIDFDSVSIGVGDLYRIEKIFQEIKGTENLPQKLILVIHTPGGLVYAASKICKYLSSTFNSIEAYVPYEAASGGTMMCLIANEIIMDQAANLTPIDPQTYYKGVRVSSASYGEAVNEFQERFGKFRPEEVPGPWQQMANNFDPIIYTEMEKTLRDSMLLAWKFLQKSQISKGEKSRELLDTVYALTKAGKPHSHIIDITEAKDIGLPISENPDKIRLLGTFKKWVSNNLLKEELTHIIQYVCPTSNATKETNAQE